MPTINKNLNKFSINFNNKESFNLYDSNDFLISKIINQATNLKKNIYFITKKCRLNEYEKIHSNAYVCIDSICFKCR